MCEVFWSLMYVSVLCFCLFVCDHSCTAQGAVLTPAFVRVFSEQDQRTDAVKK